MNFYCYSSLKQSYWSTNKMAAPADDMPSFKVSNFLYIIFNQILTLSNVVAIVDGLATRNICNM